MEINIKEQRINAGLSQDELAEKCGWEQARISHYETGRRQPKLGDLETIANALHIGVNELFMPDGKLNDTHANYSTNSLPHGKYSHINYYNSPDNNEGIIMSDKNHQEIDNTIPVNNQWLEEQNLHPKELRAIIHHGDCMLNRLHNGDVLLIKTTCKEVIDGKVYYLKYGTRHITRRLETRYDGALILNCDNPSPEYKQQTIPQQDIQQIQIIGRVIKLVSGGGF